MTQCRDDVEVVVKITDTCPCNGNEAWCCGKPGAHMDLSNQAFAAVRKGAGWAVRLLVVCMC